uniref:Odorant-binding protein 12 n=1 Tax=Anopheles minimus TaxID=112268 RepID=A0A182VYC9_9DIPT
MVAVKRNFVLLSLLLIGSSLWPSGHCNLVDISKVSLDTRYYVFFSCVRDMNVPEDLVALYAEDILPDDQVTCCVIRCVGMRLGIYDDMNGLDVDKQYERVKDRLTIDEATYKRGLRNCIRNVQRGRNLNACERAYLIITRCQGGTVRNSINQQLNEIKICD